MSMPLPILSLQPGHDRRARAGHPWVYSNELRLDPAAKALEPGTLVALADARGTILGRGHFNRHSLISLRLLERGPGPAPDAGWYRHRLRRALERREAAFARPFYRLVHAEGDGLPGLILDRFGPILTLQANSAGMDRDLPLILEALQDLLRPEALILRLETAARTQEGLEPRQEVLGSLPEDGIVPLEENGLQFLCDPAGGQKTGWFYDHRANRALAARFARDRDVLDLYSYAGGFALAAAAAGARAVTAVDRSAASLDLARRAAALNGLEARTGFDCAEVFEWLEAAGAEGRRYGLVIADPPAFAKSAKALPMALKGYRKLARLAGRLVEPGGTLLLASCSHPVSREALLAEAARAFADLGRSGSLLAATGADLDHPVHPLLPETEYLKALLFAVE